MFKLKNPNTQFPQLYPKVKRKLYTVKEKGWDMVGDFIIREGVDLIPQVGLQENLCACESNLIFICGQATSGKTFGMMLKGLQGVGKERYTGRLINVRLNDSKKGTSMFRDGMTVWGSFANCEVSTSDSPTFAWSRWNNAIQMIHANFNPDNPQEWDAFQEYIKKQQAAYIAIDEATAIERFKMFAYIFSRNRDDSGVTPSMVLSFNPKHEHWTTEFLLYAGYIGEDWKIRPEMDGATRYFYIQGDSPDKIVWGNTRAEVVKVANIKLNEDDIEAGMNKEDMVKSFTLFTGNASGNRKLVSATKGQSVANLHNVGATQRAVLAEAYFGPLESEEISVTKRMINDMFSASWDGDENMYAVLDVSGGSTESDNCPMCIFKGNMWIAVKFFRGTPKELVNWIDTTLTEYNVPIEHFAFDATGIGYYLKAYTNGVGVTANRRPIQEYDEYGNQVTLEQCFNLRSQFLNKMNVMLEKGEIACSLDKNMLIPYGKKGEKRNLIDVLYDEMNVFTFTTKNNKKYAKSKEEYKAKFHSSPDLMDSLVLIVAFFLDARPKKQPAPQIPENAYDGLYRHYSGRQKVVYV
jgi:hypothetical protein